MVIFMQAEVYEPRATHPSGRLSESIGRGNPGLRAKIHCSQEVADPSADESSTPARREFSRRVACNATYGSKLISVASWQGSCLIILRLGPGEGCGSAQNIKELCKAGQCTVKLCTALYAKGKDE